MKSANQPPRAHGIILLGIRTKTPSLRPAASLALAATFALTQLAGAAPTWNNAGGGNWSVPGNWNGGVPVSTSDVIFGNTGSGSPNTDDLTPNSIDSLTYDWSSGLQQTTVINPGQTLTVNSTLAAGTALLLAGSASAAPGANTLAPAAINGGGNLVLSGAGDIVVHLGNATAGSHMATLDLSGLANFNATIGRLLIGQANASATVNRPSGTLILAATNTITLNGASPQVIVQDSGSNANGGTASVLDFGQVTFLNGDTMRLGGQKGNATIGFAPAFSSPSVKIRNANGTSACTVIDFGYNAATSTGNSTSVTADFTAGTVDILANLMHIPQGPIGTGTGGSTATVGFAEGTLNVSDLEIGFGNATGASGATTGTLLVNNNGGAGALVIAPTLLQLAHTNGGSATVSGTLTVNGGKVEANTIASGGGVSEIDLNSFSPNSTMIVTNTIGSLTARIGTFNMADSSLTIPALNGGAVVAVKTLTIGGSANTINVSSIPPIGSYPADFTLINYQSGYVAGTGPISLGTVPSASPSYGASLVDAGGGVIKLHLTTGPVVNLGMLWTGAANNLWDLTSYDWTFLGFPTNFFNGSAPLFNDSTTQSNVVVSSTVSPSSITISNSVLQYAFTGPSNIVGATTLTKIGTNYLSLDNTGVNTINAVTIGAGTLQIGSNDVNGAISGLYITNNGALVVDRSDTLNLGSAISGTGSLTVNGSGTVILSGSNSYSGTTTLSSGTLEIDGTQTGAGTLTAAVGTELNGSGTNDSAIVVNGDMNPGPAGGMGVFTAAGGLTLNAGSTLHFDLSAATPSASDSINVVGNLTPHNNTITVNFNGTPQQNAQYVLFTYTGSLLGTTFNPVIQGTHFTVSLDTTSTPGTVYLNVTSGSGANLVWNSPSDSTWDSVAVNWQNLATTLASPFYAGDTVLLNDNSVTPALTIAAGVNVAPSVITNNSVNNFFTISGAGSISGGASIVKQGTSILAINTANTFTGTVDIQNGVLQTGNGAALGNASSTTVEPGATLDINGQNLGGANVGFSGAGYTGVGALYNGGAADFQAIRVLTLLGNATIGGSGTIEINNGGGAASLSTGGNSYSLTKAGVNTLILQNLTSVDAALANIDIQQGILEFNGLTPGMGDPTKTNIVESGAQLQFAADNVAWQKNFVFDGDGSDTTVNNGTSATTELDGPVVLNGAVVFAVGGTSLTITNSISGPGGVIKNGAAPLIFTGPTTYTGDTTVNTGGALRLAGGATLSSSTNIIINSGGFLTVTGMVSSTFPLVSGNTLRGNGVLVGLLTANAGSIVSPAVTPGSSPVGALTVSNLVTLSGTLVMQIDPANNTNDSLVSGQSSINYGGILSLTELSTPTAGKSFKLFNASSYLGSFASITPATPGAGLSWDTSALNTTGTLKVAGALLPKFGTAGVVNGKFVVTGSNGVASTTYYVLATNNVAAPIATWPRIQTNAFDINGNFKFTNSLTPFQSQEFFIIEKP
jgi:fibronectin-binding autotransporter adhesin